MSSKKKNRRRKKSNKKKIILLISLFLVSSIILVLYLNSGKENKSILKEIKPKTMYIASTTNNATIYKLEEITDDNNNKKEISLIEIEKLPRGLKLKAKDKKVKYNEEEYQLVIIDNQDYYIKTNNLKELADEVILEDKVYVRTPTNILNNMTDYKILDLAEKGEELQVIGHEKLDEEGNVYLYKVKSNDIEGYIYGKYTTYTKEEALKNYKPEVYDQIHSKVKNTYGGGEAIKLDFYPNEKPIFENNKMPDSVYALYLNSGTNIINNIDSYIEFAKTTKINSFVIDIKDNESPAYPAKTFESFSPTTHKKALNANTYDNYKNAITKLKEAGFYVIGRITVFKDSYYITDNPNNAILNKNTNKPYLHNGSYWPSPYNRDVWYYNLSLAKEAVTEFGFNEINFDYVRFPDRMNSVSHIIDLKNTYTEDKVEAIQRFVRYVTDALHELEVYVSIDVFGETTTSSYTTAYGQYWPAISNIADVISGMPYPDHFAPYSYGIAKPWNNPYSLMKHWGTAAYDRQQEIPTPASVRTWIQAYDVMKYVDANGIAYNSEAVEQEIRGLYEANLDGGYITWLSNSSLDKYKSQANAFKIDYKQEYQNR